MRFIDSSVFLHAMIKPRRRLTDREKLVKESAKNIIKRIDNGVEEVATTVVHISEIANIIETHINLLTSIGFIARILTLDNITVLDVNKDDYIKALSIAKKYMVSINDGLAYIKMNQYSIKEIYTFDKHFKRFKDIVVIQE